MKYTIKDCLVKEETALSVLRLHAEGASPTDICEKLELKFSTVNGLCKEESNKPFIDQYRKNYMARLEDVDISHKRVRLNDLEEVRIRLLGELRKTDEGAIHAVCAIVRRLIETLERAQNEMEDRPVQLAQIIANYNAFGAMNDEQIYKQREELLKLAQKSIKPRQEVLDAESETK